MTKSNRAKVHRVDSNSAWMTGCGKRRPAYHDNRLEQTIAVSTDVWSALPPAAQCIRCRRGTWARWATEEEIAAVECALIGLVAVFALPCKEWRSRWRLERDEAIAGALQREGPTGAKHIQELWDA